MRTISSSSLTLRLAHVPSSASTAQPRVHRRGTERCIKTCEGEASGGGLAAETGVVTMASTTTWPRRPFRPIGGLQGTRSETCSSFLTWPFLLTPLERPLLWPVLTRPSLAAFEVSTEERQGYRVTLERAAARGSAYVVSLPRVPGAPRVRARPELPQAPRAEGHGPGERRCSAATRRSNAPLLTARTPSTSKRVVRCSRVAASPLSKSRPWRHLGPCPADW